ncbi:autotransporter domain-containing protein [Ochrobactrum haematophilum]|uniref:Autotransporter domain-containing protein n=1 Tax=Brucella haematophila TaxID=419474 RepID=A0ABX1DUB5_9HYPH|nr:autotransporter domain-containing protein [Brucella haematophila]
MAVWGQGFGAWSDHDGNGNAAKLNHSTGGFLFGADAPVLDAWRLGIMAGYSHTSVKVDARSSSADSDNYHLGLYSGTSFDRGPGALGIRTGLAYTWHEMDFNRSVSFPGFSDHTDSSYHAGTFQAFGDLGYRFDANAVAFEPFANLVYVSLRTDSFEENGLAAALHAGDETTETSFTTLGLRASSAFLVGDTKVATRGTLGWRHAFGDVTPASALAFTGGDAFQWLARPSHKKPPWLRPGWT